LGRMEYVPAPQENASVVYSSEKANVSV
jgi:hypothetical protein